MKIMYSRARRLEIATSLYGPLKGPRAIYCLEKNPGDGDQRELITEEK